MYEMATLLSFSDYADGFRRVQEFLSFCDVIESKLENIAPSTREPILHEVSAVKMRAFSALLRAMGAYLTVLERRDMINYFAQAVFLMKQDVLADFHDNALPDVTRQSGRASGRERECQYVTISGVGVTLKKKIHG